MIILQTIFFSASWPEFDSWPILVREFWPWVMNDPSAGLFHPMKWFALTTPIQISIKTRTRHWPAVVNKTEALIQQHVNLQNSSRVGIFYRWFSCLEKKIFNTDRSLDASGDIPGKHQGSIELDAFFILIYFAFSCRRLREQRDRFLPEWQLGGDLEIITGNSINFAV